MVEMAMMRCGDTSRYQCEVDAVTPDRWEAIVASFDDGVIDQTLSFGAASWGRQRLSHLVVRSGQSVVGACQVVLLNPSVPGAGLAHVKFGPLWRRQDELSEQHLRATLQLLVDEYVRRRKLYLRIMPPACEDGTSVMADQLVDLGFVRASVPDADRYVVDLAYTPEELRARMKSKWRYHLKKAEQQELTVLRGSDADHVDEFSQLYSAMRQRKSFSDSRAVGKLSDIMAGLPPGHRTTIWLCRSGDVPLAGAIVSHIGDTALYLFGATNDMGRDARAGYLLHWAITQRLQEDGCRWYDLGGGCDEPGLHQFKSGLVGRDGTVLTLPGYFDLPAHAFNAVAVRSVLKAKDAIASMRMLLGISRPAKAR